MITGVHHFSFSVTDLNQAVDFCTKILGMTLQSKGENSSDTLGTALFGTKWGRKQKQAALKLAVLRIGDSTIEFIEYKDPKPKPYHKDPSVAGSAHLAFRVDDMEETRKRLEKAGVEFHYSINTFMQTPEIEWKWCYFRGPDGIAMELVEEHRVK